MNKIANVVYSGWMVKSPPEKKFKLSGPWKIFRAKWKRRFFVLFKPASSLPHQYVLNYYSDENCKKLKGYIDLEHCEQIIESLDLDNFPYLLAIKTYHKGKERTYFLATDTEDQMTTWVRNLCSVCGLKPEDNASDLPPDRQEATKDVKPSASVNGVVKLPPTHTKVVPPVTAQPQSQTYNHQPHNTQTHATPERQEYIPLVDCYTPKTSPFDRQVSIDSIPDEPAPPPPPMKQKPDLDDGPNDVFHPNTYDTPKSFEQGDSVYKVPPPRIVKNDSDDYGRDAYDIPPTRHSPSTPRSSSSESQKTDSAYSSQHGIAYDYPPPKVESSLTSDDVYDIPPSNPHTVTPPPPGPSDIPPARPPKPACLQEPYQNLPPTSKMFDSRNSVDINRVVPTSHMDMAGMASYDMPRSSSISATYDLPKSSLKDTSLSATPPAPHTCGQTQHSYINAGTGYITKSKEEEVYLPMERAFPPGDSQNKTRTGDPYTDMSGKHDDNYADMAGVKTSVYDHPPPARPPRISPRAAPGPDHSLETYHIYSSSRTRSFKRNYSSSTTNSSPPRDGGKIELPINQNPDCSTSSEDEDEQIWVDPAKVFQGILSVPYNSQGTNLWVSTPPAPRSQDRELKYLDLELETNSDKEPVRSPHSLQTGHSSPTEYREIDFIKTQALSDVKNDVDRQRKSEDH